MGHEVRFSSLLSLRALFAAAHSDPGLSMLRGIALGRELGGSAIPVSLRTLVGGCDQQRAVARQVLLAIADDHPERVISATRHALATATTDVGRVAAIGVLAALGEAPSQPHFADPEEIQRRSAAQLAQHIECAADVASAAQLMVEQLSREELVSVVHAMLEEAPARGRSLAQELAARLDLEPELRGDLRRAASVVHAVPREPALAVRPASVLASYVHRTGRRAIVASRRSAGSFRHFVVLIDAHEVLVDCIYSSDADPAEVHRQLIQPLLSAGYRRSIISVSRARQRVAEAARRALATARSLPSSYYLGRDLLGITADHLSKRDRATDSSAMHGHAVDLLATGCAEEALPLLERCVRRDPNDASAWASLGACLAALADSGDDLHRTRAAHAFRRAARLEPRFADHHWNAAALAKERGDHHTCYQSLQTFRQLVASGDPRSEIAAKVLLELARGPHAERLPRAVKVGARARRARRRHPTHADVGEQPSVG